MTSHLFEDPNFLCMFGSLLVLAIMGIKVLWEGFGEDLKRRKNMTDAERFYFYMFGAFRVMLTIAFVLMVLGVSVIGFAASK